MIPLLTVKPLALLGGAVVAVAIGFSGGWFINGWRLAADVAETKQAGAEFRMEAAKTALDELIGRMDEQNAQATAANLDVRTLDMKMDQLRKDFKNAKTQNPLPIDCRPDSGRLLNLRQAVGAANAAIAGSAPVR